MSVSSFEYSTKIHENHYAGEIPVISIFTGTCRIATATCLIGAYVLKLLIVLPIKAFIDTSNVSPLNEAKDTLKALAFNVEMIGLGLLEVTQFVSVIHPYIISPIAQLCANFAEAYKNSTPREFSEKIHENTFFEKGRNVLLIAALSGACRIITATFLIAIYTLKLLFIVPIKAGIDKAMKKEVTALTEAKAILQAMAFNTTAIGLGILEVLQFATGDRH